MPRPKRGTRPPDLRSAPNPQGNTIVASAARITSRNGKKPTNSGAIDWQKEAWRYLDTVGELRFGTQWLANALSRCTLTVQQRQPDDSLVPVTTGPAADALDALTGGGAHAPQMLSSMAAHLEVPGETWLIGAPEDYDDPASPDRWSVLSNEEITLTGASWEVDRGDGVKLRYSDGTNTEAKSPVAQVLRIWRPHPRMWIEADSPVRACLPVLRELEGLTRHVGSTIDSRLAGAGLLAVPSEMTFQTPLLDDASADDPEQDPFMVALYEAAQAAIQDPGSAAARTPVIVKAPGAFLGNIQHITFDSPLSAQALELRTEAIRRLALGLDMPPEVLLGQSDSNHWSAWLISEDAIKIHVEPLLGVLVQALTREYLWPTLQGASPTLTPEDQTYVIVGETTNLTLRPDRTPQATTLHGMMLLSDEALRRESGFDESDAPKPEEVQARLLMKVAQGVPSPDLVAAALAAAGTPLAPMPSRVPGDEPHPVGSPTGPDPTAPAPPAIEAPRNPPPVPAQPPPADQAAALLAASELMVLRAMERANNRANRRGRSRAVPADQMDACLVDAWQHVPRVSALCGVDPERLASVCDTYARRLLASGTEHRPEEFATMLRTHVLAAT